MSFHINPNQCRATKRECPYGGTEEHYESKEAARKAYEAKQGSGGAPRRLTHQEKVAKGNARAKELFQEVKKPSNLKETQTNQATKTPQTSQKPRAKTAEELEHEYYTERFGKDYAVVETESMRVSWRRRARFSGIIRAFTAINDGDFSYSHSASTLTGDIYYNVKLAGDERSVRSFCESVGMDFDSIEQV